MERTPYDVMETYLTQVGGQGRYDLINELAQPDMIDEANQAFGGPPGRDGLIAHVQGFRRALNAPEFTIDRIVAGTDQVMAWWSFTGTHVGPWLNRMPTGEPVSGTVFSFFELRQGRIARYRLWLCAMLDMPVIFDSSRPDLFGGRP